MCLLCVCFFMVFNRIILIIIIFGVYIFLCPPPYNSNFGFYEIKFLVSTILDFKYNYLENTCIVFVPYFPKSEDM